MPSQCGFAAGACIVILSVADQDLLAPSEREAVKLVTERVDQEMAKRRKNEQESGHPG